MFECYTTITFGYKLGKWQKDRFVRNWYVELKMAVQKSFFEINLVPLPATVKIFQSVQTCLAVKFHIQYDWGNVLKVV